MSTIADTHAAHLSHDMVCCYCEHARHTFLPCSDTCSCVPPPPPGLTAVEFAHLWSAGLAEGAAQLVPLGR